MDFRGAAISRWLISHSHGLFSWTLSGIPTVLGSFEYHSHPVGCSSTSEVKAMVHCLSWHSACQETKPSFVISSFSIIRFSPILAAFSVGGQTLKQSIYSPGTQQFVLIENILNQTAAGRFKTGRLHITQSKQLVFLFLFYLVCLGFFCNSNCYQNQVK